MFVKKAMAIDLSGLKLFESKFLMEPLLNFLPLSRDREGELAVFVRFDRGRAVIIQLVKIITELELGRHNLVPCHFLSRMASGSAHQRRQIRVNRALYFIMRPVPADTLNQFVPLILPGTIGILCRRP